MDKLGFYEDTAKNCVALLVSVTFFLAHKGQNSKKYISHISSCFDQQQVTVPHAKFLVLEERQNLEKENVIPVDRSNIQTLK